jgi:hypothetical protein
MIQINDVSYDPITSWMKEKSDDLDHYYYENHRRLYSEGFCYKYRSFNDSFSFKGTKNNNF